MSPKLRMRTVKDGSHVIKFQFWYSSSDADATAWQQLCRGAHVLLFVYNNEDEDIVKKFSEATIPKLILSADKQETQAKSLAEALSSSYVAFSDDCADLEETLINSVAKEMGKKPVKQKKSTKKKGCLKTPKKSRKMTTRLFGKKGILNDKNKKSPKKTKDKKRHSCDDIKKPVLAENSDNKPQNADDAKTPLGKKKKKGDDGKTPVETSDTTTQNADDAKLSGKKKKKGDDGKKLVETSDTTTQNADDSKISLGKKKKKGDDHSPRSRHTVSRQNPGTVTMSSFSRSSNAQAPFLSVSSHSALLSRNTRSSSTRLPRTRIVTEGRLLYFTLVLFRFFTCSPSFISSQS
eukprot:TRINITY_DN1733_c0_g1_i3.p1 TRINITY_DN1733_c0_g1~~TRINITY_DN1733_c0_g1_i3.p1  ORF type:complete len:349 (+),score=76.83 TRINITY_DN1733_c0_g1_i3:171-1217(+)